MLAQRKYVNKVLQKCYQIFIALLKFQHAIAYFINNNETITVKLKIQNRCFLPSCLICKNAYNCQELWFSCEFDYYTNFQLVICSI